MNDSLANLSCSSDEFRKNIPVVILFSIISVTGVIGNSLIIFIYGFYFKETTTRVFILSLAVFDLITCATLPYKIILLRYGQLFENSHLARLEIVRIYFLQVSAMILPLVSIDRYRRICLPYKRQITPKIAKILVIIVSVILAAIGIFRMVVSSNEHCYRAEAFISQDYLKDDVRKRWVNQFYFVYVILPFITPLPILIIMYGLVGAKVHTLQRNSVSSPTHVPNRLKDTPPTRPLTSRNSDPEEAEVTHTVKGNNSSQLRDMEFKDRYGVDRKQKARSVIVIGSINTQTSRRNIHSMENLQDVCKTRSVYSDYDDLPKDDDMRQESTSNRDKEIPLQRRRDMASSHCEHSVSSIDDNNLDVSIAGKVRIDVQSSSPPHNNIESGHEGITPPTETKFHRNQSQCDQGGTTPPTETKFHRNQSQCDQGGTTPPTETKFHRNQSQCDQGGTTPPTETKFHRNQSQCDQGGTTPPTETSFHWNQGQAYQEGNAHPSDTRVPRNQSHCDQGGTTPSSETRFPWKRMTFIFFLITVLYIISCIPFITLFIIFRVDSGYGHQLLSQGVYIVLYDFVYITVVSNCFLYGFFDPRFRKKLSLVKDKIIGQVSRR